MKHGCYLCLDPDLDLYTYLVLGRLRGKRSALLSSFVSAGRFPFLVLLSAKALLTLADPTPKVPSLRGFPDSAGGL